MKLSFGITILLPALTMSLALPGENLCRRSLGEALSDIIHQRTPDVQCGVWGLRKVKRTEQIAEEPMVKF